MDRQTRRYSILAASALLAGLLLRLWFIRNLSVIAGDSLMYGDIAKNLLRHGSFAFTEAGLIPHTIQIRPTLIRLPGYPFFLAACFKLFGMENYRAVLYIQASADLVACCFTAATAARLFGRRAGLAAMWICALCPFTASYVAAALTETLVLTSIAVALYGFLRWQQGGCGYNPWLWMTAIALAISILLRPEQVLFAAAILGGMGWASLRACNPSRSGLRHTLPVFSAALLILLPLIPWTIRNARTLHVFQPLAPRYANDPGEHAPLGFARWYRTWATDFADTENVYWNYPSDPIAFSDLPVRAYAAATPAATQPERDRTAQLIADYNSSPLSKPAVFAAIDARFAALGEQRVHEHPVLYYFSLPLARVANMIFRPRIEMMPIADGWWQWREHRAQTAFTVFYAALNIACLVAALLGLHMWHRHKWKSASGNFRDLAFAMIACLLLRIALLLTIDNSEPRYTLEFFPVFFLWIAALFAPSSPRASRAARDN